MITIANPIYDVVFKYLLEDLDIARDLLSLIIGQEIVRLDAKPQEVVLELEGNLLVRRFDFHAIITTDDGETKKVLIELQKAKHWFDIMRFRRYLADNYAREDTFTDEYGIRQKQPLEIVPIYLLGFELAAGYPAVFQLKHVIIDVITSQTIDGLPKEPFVALLNHNGYTVQIPRLTHQKRTRLERVLAVFNQAATVIDDNHKIKYEEAEDDDGLTLRITRRLTRAIADDDVRRKMDLEDEIERMYLSKLRQKDAIIEHFKTEADKNKAEADKNKAEADKNKAALDQKDAEMAEKDAEMAEKDAEIQKLLAQLNKK